MNKRLQKLKKGNARLSKISKDTGVPKVKIIHQFLLEMEKRDDLLALVHKHPPKPKRTGIAGWTDLEKQIVALLPFPAKTAAKGISEKQFAAVLKSLKAKNVVVFDWESKLYERNKGGAQDEILLATPIPAALPGARENPAFTAAIRRMRAVGILKQHDDTFIPTGENWGSLLLKLLPAPQTSIETSLGLAPDVVRKLLDNLIAKQTITNTQGVYEHVRENVGRVPTSDKKAGGEIQY